VPGLAASKPQIAIFSSLRFSAAERATARGLLQNGATREVRPASHTQGNAMRSLLKSGPLVDLQQNKAGLIADLAILALFLVLLALR
jgi:hypothetical protein